MMMPLLAFLAHAVASVPLVHDGGACLGLSWVQLAPHEKAAVQHGPDFDIYRFHGPAGENDHWWAAYSGRFASARPEGPILIKRDGVTVRRAMAEGAFDGYLVENGSAQNHFFGSIFNGSLQDLAFFQRLDFGAKAQSLCAKGTS